MLATILSLGCILYDMRFPGTLQLQGNHKRRFSIRLTRFLGGCRLLSCLLWAISSIARAGVALVGGLHVITIHVGWAVDVAQVLDAIVGVEDERTTVVGEQISGARLIVVEEQVFGVGEFDRDGIVVGVAGLQVSGDEVEILLLTRASVDEEPHRAGTIAPVGPLLEDLVVWNMLWRLEVPDLRIPSIGSRPLCVFRFRPRGSSRLEGLGGLAHLRLLEGPYRLPGES